MAKERPSEKDQARTQWFRKAHFGMFITWSLYSLTGQGGWEWRRGWINQAEWEAAANRFRPKHFDPAAWAQLAKEAGMKYAVLTTMSHDGFAIFDSPVSDFTSAKTAAGRDVVAEYVRAFRKAGLKVGLYYSLIDWRWPAHRLGPKKDPKGWSKFLDYVHANVRALCTQYGKIDLLWYDGHAGYSAQDWQSAKLNALVRRLQPHILINDRSQTPEDFSTPEQRGGHYLGGRPWELCMTTNDHWPYTRGDHNWKSTRQLLFTLADCAAGGGNLLLNVGPTPDGMIPAPAANRLRQMGEWLRKYGEAIYGTDFCPICQCPYTPKTMKGNKIYLLVKYWSHDGTYHLMDFPQRKAFERWQAMIIPQERPRPGQPEMIKSAYVLPNRERLKVSWKGDGILLSGLPKRAPDPYLSVIVLELRGK